MQWRCTFLVVDIALSPSSLALEALLKPRTRAVRRSNPTTKGFGIARLLTDTTRHHDDRTTQLAMAKKPRSISSQIRLRYTPLTSLLHFPLNFTFAQPNQRSSQLWDRDPLGTPDCHAVYEALPEDIVRFVFVIPTGSKSVVASTWLISDHSQ
ncbi:hypothetical protein BDY19DRAFT_550623 [Irpex rosettiformis]|uniref:Uncharacterized protein n=1 Tax=Irpex rosettiformis TaxID=378272 RepID=A0ACB8TQD7_9APHY|nr:hypothetical protein BDY19DRAFT_550623 [Irpex rosettiformis]